MSTPLLRTKLHVPPLRAELVPRPHLLKRLHAGLGETSSGLARRLTLVCAPAGSGKTTLVTSWLSRLHLGSRDTLARSGESQTRDHVAWLSLDEADNDPTRFLTYLVAALRTVDPQIGQDTRRLLERAPPASVERLVTSLINDLTGRATPVILVLDDYHAIRELVIHEAIGLLLERQPPYIHMIIATRHDPPLPVSRLRGRGQITEIRQRDLRFSFEEVAAFLNRSMGLQLTPSQIATLEERTEGWIAGLQLAALSMRGRERASIARFVADFSGRYHVILDYLTDEVLKRQPECIQTFLLQTSVLDRMCGPLCDAVLKRGDLPPGQSLLEQVEAANLFLVPLDEERDWYRYHYLFAELLQAKLHEAQPGLIAPLHRRAAAWYERAGFRAEAVHHALATGDDALAAEVIERAIVRTSTWSRTDVAIIQRWLNALPEEIIQLKPCFRLVLARVLYVCGEPERAGQKLQTLEAWLRDHPSSADADRILSLAVVDRASYATLLGHVREARALASQVLDQVAEDDPINRFRAPAITGMAHLRAGAMREAHRAFTEASEIALKAGLSFAAVPFLCNLAEVEIIQGQLRQAMRTCERAGELVVVDGVPLSTAAFVELERGKILHQWNELDVAERHVLEGVKHLVQGGISGSFGSGYAVLAEIRQALGDERGAREAAQQAVKMAKRDNVPRLVGLTSAYQARIWLAQEQLDRAIRWAEGYRQIGETEYLREFEDLTLARVLLADSRSTEALALVDARLVPARASGRLSSVIEMEALRALALDDSCGQLDDALEALQRALRLAEPEGFIRCFLDEGEPMQGLLRQAARRGIAPHYVSRLLEAFGPSPGDRTRRVHPLVEPLTDRELEVLDLLDEGLSNREIGERLFIALPTVKSHTGNIYGKLGVHGREEAVTRARALGILPS